MFIAIIVFHILASIFLILVILLQAGRGSGLAEGFGGGTVMQNIFGSSSSTVLTKATAVCAVVFIVTSLTLTILTSRRGKSLIDLEKAKVGDIVAGQKPKEAVGATAGGVNVASPKEAPAQTTTPAKGEVNAPEKTVTVREVKIDPATGKEIVVKEEKMTPEEAAERQKSK
jgi:preprotein translocase subunit SecG